MGFHSRGRKKKETSYLSPPFLFLSHSLSVSLLVFVKLQREKHLSPLFGQHYVIEGMCHCVCVCVCVCACVFVCASTGVCACLFGCLDEREITAASIPYLPTYLRVFERSPAVWWPIQWSVAHIKCLITQSEWVSDETCLLARERLMCRLADILDWYWCFT